MSNPIRLLQHDRASICFSCVFEADDDMRSQEVVAYAKATPATLARVDGVAAPSLRMKRGQAIAWGAERSVWQWPLAKVNLPFASASHSTSTHIVLVIQ